MPRIHLYFSLWSCKNYQNHVRIIEITELLTGRYLWRLPSLSAPGRTVASTASGQLYSCQNTSSKLPALKLRVPVLCYPSDKEALLNILWTSKPAACGCFLLFYHMLLLCIWLYSLFNPCSSSCNLLLDLLIASSLVEKRSYLLERRSFLHWSLHLLDSLSELRPKIVVLQCFVVLQPHRTE